MHSVPESAVVEPVDTMVGGLHEWEQGQGISQAAGHARTCRQLHTDGRRCSTVASLSSVAQQPAPNLPGSRGVIGVVAVQVCVFRAAGVARVARGDKVGQRAGGHGHRADCGLRDARHHHRPAQQKVHASLLASSWGTGLDAIPWSAGAWVLARASELKQVSWNK